MLIEMLPGYPGQFEWSRLDSRNNLNKYDVASTWCYLATGDGGVSTGITHYNSPTYQGYRMPTTGTTNQFITANGISFGYAWGYNNHNQYVYHDAIKCRGWLPAQQQLAEYQGTWTELSGGQCADASGTAYMKWEYCKSGKTTSECSTDSLEGAKLEDAKHVCGLNTMCMGLSVQNDGGLMRYHLNIDAGHGDPNDDYTPTAYFGASHACVSNGGNGAATTPSAGPEYGHDATCDNIYIMSLGGSQVGGTGVPQGVDTVSGVYCLRKDPPPMPPPPPALPPSTLVTQGATTAYAAQPLETLDTLDNAVCFNGLCAEPLLEVPITHGGKQCRLTKQRSKTVMFCAPSPP